MSGQEISLVCPDCRAPVSVAPELAGEIVRCEACFQVYLREADAGFLDDYVEFGSVRHRVVAETAARALVLGSPSERKVLAMAVFEQFLESAADLIGLYHAIKDREQRPLIESFLRFELDAATARGFFGDMDELDEAGLLAALGLPEPEQIAGQNAGWDDADLARAARALWRAMNGLKRSAASRYLSERALVRARGELRVAAQLVSQARWIPDADLAAHEVGAMAVDYQRRKLALRRLSIDESEIGEMLTAIDTLSRAAGDLAYAYLLLHRPGDRPRLEPPG